MKRLFGVTTEKNFKLEYYIADDGKVFGIEVIKKYTEDGIEDSEKGSFSGISDDENTVTEIVEMLIRNTVTPLGLAYVMEDMMCR